MIGASTILAEACLKASGNVHRDSLVRVLKAPMGWFESIPSGRILTRFSSDLTVVDIQLGNMMDNGMNNIALIVVFFGTVCFVVPQLPPVAPVLFGTYCFFILGVDRTMREVKRIMDRVRAPSLSNLSETVQARALSKHDT